jgi:hypothetical protein
MAKELDYWRSAVSDARRALRSEENSHREARLAALEALRFDPAKVKLNNTGDERCCLE